MTTATIDHIVIDDKGRAKIKDSRHKVIQIVIDKKEHGFSPEEIQEQFPDLSLAAIHAALAYYYDHKEELDKEIEAYSKFSEKMRQEAFNSPVQKKLRSIKEGRK